MTLIEMLENYEPRSKMEAYLKNCCLACGCDGLPTPVSTTDVLLYKLSEQLAGGGTSGDSGGGGVAHSEIEKIVDYTVDADSAAAKVFAFTADEYPKLAKYNHFSFIFRKTANSTMPWVQLLVNSTTADKNAVGKTASGNYSMSGGKLVIKDGYAHGYMCALANPSLYVDWAQKGGMPQHGCGSHTPLYVGEVNHIAIVSYTAFLDEGGRIEIWGWNE